jgi:hypothetical protein
VTDVGDAAWLAELLEHGLLRGSFVPPPPIGELRDLTRYRKRLIQAHASEGQRIHKTLEDAGSKLDSVAAREELGLLSVVTPPCPGRSVHPVGMMRSAGGPVRVGVAGMQDDPTGLPAVTIGPVPEDASRRCHVCQ